MTATGLVVIGSPNPGSFVHAMAARATASLEHRGVTCEVHDLYAEGFQAVAPPDEAFTLGRDVEAAIAASGDPVVRTHRRALSQAEHLVVAHPNWWGKPPAIMAGWLDRVLVPGVAYRLATREGEPVSLLRLRTLLVLNTGDTPPEREATQFGDPLDDMWRRCVGAYLGGATIRRVVASPVGGSTQAQRQSWLGAVELAADTP
jgi:NAD(P)H dehydrogenase (quinone)